MEFLLENYVWIIVVAVFIIMMIIGYFADKKEKKSREPMLKDHVDEMDDNHIEPVDIDANISEWEDKPVKKDEDIVETETKDDFYDWENNIDNPINEVDSNNLDNIENKKDNDIENSAIPEYNDSMDTNWGETFDDLVKENKTENEKNNDSKDDVKETEKEKEPKKDKKVKKKKTTKKSKNKDTEEEKEEKSIEEEPEKIEKKEEKQIDEIEKSEIEEPSLQNDNWGNDDLKVDNMEISLPNIDTLNDEIKDVIDNDDIWKF